MVWEIFTIKLFFSKLGINLNFWYLTWPIFVQLILVQSVQFSKEFNIELSEILDTDYLSLNDTFILRSGKWDSVTILRIILLVQKQFNVIIHGELIYNCQQLLDLKNLVINKK